MKATEVIKPYFADRHTREVFYAREERARIAAKRKKLSNARQRIRQLIHDLKVHEREIDQLEDKLYAETEAQLTAAEGT